MREGKRSIWSRAGTFSRFVLQQWSRRKAIASALTAPDPAAPVLLSGAEAGWISTGHHVRCGESFRLDAAGWHWVAKPLVLALEPQATVWMRIGDTPIRKVIEAQSSYVAWADGEIEVMSKSLSEWANEQGAILPGKRPRQGPGISIRTGTDDRAPTPTGQPNDWTYLWRLGEGRIFTETGSIIDIATHGDVGILCKRIDHPLCERTELSWDWLVSALPSVLPEDLAFTHDYLSIALLFDNGRDLTYMWSAGLPQNHVFRCPLNWWCERETHWALRSGTEGLGAWQHETRPVAADYREAIGDTLPSSISEVWLIANSVFQRARGRASFRNIVVAG